MQMHSSISRVTTLQAGWPLYNGVLQLRLTANLKVLAQLSICEAVTPLLMSLWHYTKWSKRTKLFSTCQNYIFKYTFTKQLQWNTQLGPLVIKKLYLQQNFIRKNLFFPYLHNISEVYEPWTTTLFTNIAITGFDEWRKQNIFLISDVRVP
jgi:hypothetical protein